MHGSYKLFLVACIIVLEVRVRGLGIRGFCEGVQGTGMTL